MSADGPPGKYKMAKSRATPYDRKGIIRRVTDSVSGLFSTSWLSGWMAQQEEEAAAVSSAAVPTAAVPSVSHAVTHAGENFSFPQPSTSRRPFKPFYPEEGETTESQQQQQQLGVNEGASTSRMHPQLGVTHPQLGVTQPQLGVTQPQLGVPVTGRRLPVVLSTSTPTSGYTATSTPTSGYASRVKAGQLEPRSLPLIATSTPAVGDDGSSEVSESSVDTGVDASVIPRPDERDYQREILQLDEESLQTLRESLSKTVSAGNSPGTPAQTIISALQTRKRPRELEPDQSSVRAEGSVSSKSLFSDVGSVNHGQPQPSGLASKRPRFNISMYGSPLLDDKSVLSDSAFKASPFYPGKTMYGGASAYTRRRLHNTSQINRSQVKAKAASECSSSDGGLSQAARRILEGLEQMSTPISDAKRIPTPSGHRGSFLDHLPGSYRGTMAYHRNRSSLRTSTPPTTSLLTPTKVSLQSNLAATLLNPSRTPGDTQSQGGPTPQAETPLNSTPGGPILNPGGLIVNMDGSGAPGVAEPPATNSGKEVEGGGFRFGISDGGGLKFVPKPAVSEPLQKPSGGGKMTTKVTEPTHISLGAPHSTPPDTPLPKVPLQMSTLPTITLGTAPDIFKPSLRDSVAPDSFKPSPREPLGSFKPSPREPLDSFKPSLRDSIAPDSFKSSLRDPPDSFKPSLPDSFKPSLPDSFKPSLPDSFKPSLPDSFKPSLPDSFKFSLPPIVSQMDSQGSPLKAVGSPPNFTFRSPMPLGDLREGAVGPPEGPMFNPGPLIGSPNTNFAPKLKSAQGSESEKKSELKTGSILDILKPKGSSGVTNSLPKDLPNTKDPQYGSRNDPEDARPPRDLREGAMSAFVSSGGAAFGSGVTASRKSPFGGASDLREAAGRPEGSQGSSGGTPGPPEGAGGFGEQFKKPEGSWDCGTCLVQNPGSSSSCLACETPNTKSFGGATKPEGAFGGMKSPPGAFGGATKPPGGFGEQFKKPEGSWDCETCLVRNKNSSSSCVACETPNPKAVGSTKAIGSALGSFGSPATSFGGQWGKREGEWECDTCLVRNKDSSSSCVACETPNTKSVGSTKPPKAFGGAPKGDWECDTCLVRNKENSVKCIACETPKPGETSSNQFITGNFKFGASNTGSSQFVSSANQFKFSDSTGSGQFKFGLDKPDKISSNQSDKPDSGFKFGLDKPDNTSNNQFKFGLDKSDKPDNSSSNQIKFGAKPDPYEFSEEETSSKQLGTSYKSDKVSSNQFKFGAKNEKDKSAEFKFGAKSDGEFKFGAKNDSEKLEKSTGFEFGAKNDSEKSSQNIIGFKFGAEKVANKSHEEKSMKNKNSVGGQKRSIENSDTTENSVKSDNLFKVTGNFGNAQNFEKSKNNKESISVFDVEKPVNFGKVDSKNEISKTSSNIFGTDRQTDSKNELPKNISNIFGTDRQTDSKNEISKTSSNIFGTDRQTDSKNELPKSSNIFGTDRQTDSKISAPFQFTINKNEEKSQNFGMGASFQFGDRESTPTDPHGPPKKAAFLNNGVGGDTPSQIFSFGSKENKLGSGGGFGGSFGSSANTKANPTAFGSTPANPQALPTAFGSSSNTKATPAFGSPTPQAPTAFGSSTKPATAFGSPNPSLGAPSFQFGSASTPKGTAAPNFGAAMPAFGASAPSFGGAPAGSGFAFGQGDKKSSAGFDFGQAASGGAGAPQGFNFGGPQAPPSAAAAPAGMFQFGSSQNTVKSTGGGNGGAGIFQFGSSNTELLQQPTPAAFGSGGDNPFSTAAGGGGGGGGVGGGGTPSGRVVKKAIRRNRK